MLRDGQWHSAIEMLRSAMALLGPFSPVPWLAQIAFHFIPWMYVIRDWFAMLRWCKQRMEERMQVSYIHPRGSPPALRPNGQSG